jgi:arylsulfatase A-like enzyme
MEAVMAALGAGAVLGPVALTGCSSGTTNQGSGSAGEAGTSTANSTTPPPAPPLNAKPNILLVLMDEFRVPPVGYAPPQGELEGMKEIFRFEPTLSPDNPFIRYFEGLVRLRKNAVILRTHYIASAACVPSRTAMLTGQYSSLTHVTSTDGIFKSGDQLETAGLFLDPSGVPTIGDWFRAAGYQSKYFGKWHLSNEGSAQAPWDLSPWGFDCWTESGPEPHGAAVQNLGVFRDPGFALNAVNFLTQQGNCIADPDKPWFAVSSFVNPHDIGNWPFPWTLPFPNGVIPNNTVPPTEPQPLPAAGLCAPNPNVFPPVQNPNSEFPDECSPEPSVALNPDGFPQACFGLPPTLDEDLSTKPTCQYEYSYKLGLALRSNAFGVPPIEAITPFPLQTQGAKTIPWTLAYGQFWTYLHYLSDLQMRKVLKALDDSGLAPNTIVIFTSDHGEYAAAHGYMMQKWHSAYEEATRVPFVVSSPLVNPSENVMREVLQPTGHIDLCPTLLGLAGFTPEQVAEIQTKIVGQTTRPFVGADLSPYIRGEASGPILGKDGLPRNGVLFVTDDEITAPLPGQAGAQYQNYLAEVEVLRAKGVQITPGSVRQPNHVHAVCDGTWKFVRYFDPQGFRRDEWELYYIPADPNETVNLLDYRTFAVRTTVGNLTVPQIQAQRDQMLVNLRRQERELLQVQWLPQTSTTTQILRGITYGTSDASGQFVAVGDGGVIVTSINSSQWTPRTSGTTQILLGVTFANGLYVAVGLQGTVLTSPDAITWTAQNSGTTKNLTGIAFLNGLFAAVGDTGTIITSPDAITWTPRVSGVAQNLEGVAAGNGLFVAVGLGGNIVTSTDGATWTLAASGVSQDLFAVAFGNGLFFATGALGTIVTSPDGATWTRVNSGTTFNLFGAGFGNALYLAVGANGLILNSVDGVTFTSNPSGTTRNLRAISGGNLHLVAVGDSGTILTTG